MVAKKRTLRSKIASRSSAPVVTRVQEYSSPDDPKAFLHLFKETKKNKKLSRSNDFIKRINSNSGISKSSLKRRKRKQKEELMPKMEELLTVLETNDGENTEEKSSIKIVDSGFINVKKNQPNPQRRRGAKQIELVEKSQFTSILKNSNFKKTPFDTLRESISHRLQVNKDL